MSGMIHETLRRQGAFQPGMEISLADHQAWSFPTVDGVARLTSGAQDREYLGLLGVHRTAEDQAEQRLAELSLAIFLIRLNYHLDAEELRALFTFPPASPGLAEAQAAFRSLAHNHLRGLQASTPGVADDQEGTAVQPGLWTRGLNWLRQILTARRGYLGPTDGGVSLPS